MTTLTGLVFSDSGWGQHRPPGFDVFLVGRQSAGPGGCSSLLVGLPAFLLVRLCLVFRS